MVEGPNWQAYQQRERKFNSQLHENADDGVVTALGAVLLAFAVFLLVYVLIA